MRVSEEVITVQTFTFSANEVDVIYEALDEYLHRHQGENTPTKKKIEELFESISETWEGHNDFE